MRTSGVPMETVIEWLDAFTLSNEHWTSLIGLCLTLLTAAMWCKYLLYPRFVTDGDFDSAVKALSGGPIGLPDGADPAAATPGRG